MTRIAVVEDDESIQKLITYALTANGYEARGFSDGQSFLDDAEKFEPALVLLDVMMPGIDGIQVLRCLRRSAKFAEIPVMMLTAKSAEADKVSTLDLGADDYMTKPFGVMELISRVKALMRRSRGMEEERMIRLGPIFMDDEKRAVFVDDEQCELTYKEYELLKLLLLNAGIVASRDMILDRVWGTDFEGESRTLDMHIKTLRQKLGSAGAMIRTVRNVGYMLTGENN